MAYQFTAYFENDVLRRRSYLRKERCIAILEDPIHIEEQPDGRVRFWGRVPEFGNRVFRRSHWPTGRRSTTLSRIGLSRGEEEMEINYYPETDSLYVAFSSRPSVDSVEIGDGFVVDLDAAGNVVGIDIDTLASQKVDLSQISVRGLHQNVPA